jgi:hypothetical protein
MIGTDTFEKPGPALRAEMGLITPSELAAMLNVKEHTLVVWRTRRIGPSYVKLGREIFYHDALVREWINANVIQTDRTRDTDEDL